MQRVRDVEEATETTSLLPVVSISKNDGLPRYCESCQCYKPDRAHHCKECNMCILKMDQLSVVSCEIVVISNSLLLVTAHGIVLANY